MMGSDNSNITGEKFIRRLIAATLALGFFYILLHATTGFWYSSSTRIYSDAPAICGASTDNNSANISWQYFVTLTPDGQVYFKNIGDMDWYVGAERAAENMKKLREQQVVINDAMAKLMMRIDALRTTVLSDPEPAENIKNHIMQGDYSAAIALFDQTWRQLTQESRTKYHADVNPDVVHENLNKIRSNMLLQCEVAQSFSPPLARMFFWTSPTLSILEVLFWALFGVLTNLLVNSAEYLRKGDFRPAERWVAHTKLVYGPILAMILVLAMINGWFTIDSYEVRVWSLPLVGFVFGFATRRTARLLEMVLEKFISKAEEGIKAGPEAARKSRDRVIQRLMEASKPRTTQELREDAKKISGELIAATIEEKKQ